MKWCKEYQLKTIGKSPRQDVVKWCKEHKLKTIGESPRRHVIDTHFEPRTLE